MLFDNDNDNRTQDNDNAADMGPADPQRNDGQAIFERFRPQTFGEILGQEKALKQLQRATRVVGIGGNAFFFTGASGTGKSSIARILAGMVADQMATREIEARALTPSGIAELERDYHNRTIGAGGWAIIVNEAHWLRKDSVAALLDVLERLPKFVVWIFTMTSEGSEKFEEIPDSAPFLSRCVEITLARRNLTSAFAPRLLAIAQELGLAGSATVEDCVKLLETVRNNFRRALQAIVRGALLD